MMQKSLLPNDQFLVIFSQLFGVILHHFLTRNTVDTRIAIHSHSVMTQLS